jgi:L-amino acid N-acyltransferase YncA
MNIDTFQGIVEITDTYLQLKDNKLNINKTENDIYTLISDFSGFQELFKLNPKLCESFRVITNNAFQRELPFTIDSTYKRIVEFKKDELSTDLMTMVYDIKNKEIVTCMSHGDQKTNFDYTNNYIYAVFTNPKYYRKGYASQMLTKHIDNKIKEEKSFVFISTIYVWNTPSFNMFQKLGFISFEVKQPEDSEEHMKRKNIEYMPVFGYIDGKPITEDYYYIMVLPSKHLLETDENELDIDDTPNDIKK